MDNEAIDVVVVNWNSGSQVSACVNSIFRFGNRAVSAVIVVDNGSEDGSEKPFEDCPNVRLIRAGGNLGFAAACNLGALEAKGDYILFLNPDAALYLDTLRQVLVFMQAPENSSVGICGVQLKDESGHVARSCARFPSLKQFAANALGLDRIWPRLSHFMIDWDHGDTRQVDQVIGAFFLVRRPLFEKLSGFDERFFVYFEEVDFSLRALQAGWSSMYFAEAQAFHAGGGTSNQVKAKRLFYSLRSRLLYAFKHFSWFEAFLVLLLTLFVEPLSRSALALARCSWPSLKEIWSAYGMLWRWLPQWVFRGVTR